MDNLYYVGLDIHKKIITFCVKKSDGEIIEEGGLPATREALRSWQGDIQYSWIGGMEATMFTGWVYDTLKPYTKELKVANPKMLKAIVASKKKNDRIDARKIADALRADLLPECYMAPAEIRDLRRCIRYRNFLVRQATRLKNKTAGLLMECGVEYNKRKLHGKRYFNNLVEGLWKIDEIPESMIEMLKFNRHILEIYVPIQKRIIAGLQKHPLLKERVERLQTIDGVGEVLSLSWALEIGDPHRFSSIKKAISYCGLCSGEKSSAGKNKRGPISKERNKHIQWVLIEAAKIAIRYNPRLAEVYEKELKGGNKNSASLAVARKLVAYLLAIDKSGKKFEYRTGGDRKAVLLDHRSARDKKRRGHRAPKPPRPIATFSPNRFVLDS